MIDFDRLADAHLRVSNDLLMRRNDVGFWEGCLASSALSTATAISAICLVERHSKEAIPSLLNSEELISQGLNWLAASQNGDGGWGDTDKSNSNISTTMLVNAAFHISGENERHHEMLERAESYIQSKGGINGLRERYGKDKTFAVPILTNCALAGLVPWKKVSPLPFELACFPQSFYRFLRLPVVSYAIPALVAIGQARYFHRKPWNPISRFIRRFAVEPSLKVLRRIQPSSGGYLEAIPLTSFVMMSLASIGRADHAVVQSGLSFLLDTVRKDGSWPIDTNLSTWNTTLAVNGFSNCSSAYPQDLSDCLSWILSCQNETVHPFTGADAGGWGWSDLSGAVPDADDTPGALLAIKSLSDRAKLDDDAKARVKIAATNGIRWLLDLQNRDGGWPTFCKGWGTLPFDRSGSDLTAHAIRSISCWSEVVDSQTADEAIAKGFRYLEKQQREDGSWIPLWFGNQDHPCEENPVYGTSKVLLAYRDLGRLADPAAIRARDWLIGSQNSDGSWGSGVEPTLQDISGSVEETALAVESLLSFDDSSPLFESCIEKGIRWLCDAVESNRHRTPSPIGFYFAKLWYYEELYPLLFSLSALGKAVTVFSKKHAPSSVVAT